MASRRKSRSQLCCLLLLRQATITDAFWVGLGHAIGRTASSISISTRRKPCRSSKKDSLGDEYCPLPSVLPVFPLRKSVKLPTETLTLNLYEERYLAMCDFILNDCVTATHDNPTKKVFGAIYGSEKPQIVPGGIGPIVPLYEPGDIGTIFSVEHAEEGYRRDDPMLGRRIRILGVGIGRFRIEKVLQNGYGGGDACTENNEPSLPFILVEPSRVKDEIMVSLDSNDELRLVQLQRQLKEKMSEKAKSAPRFDTNDSNEEERNSEEDQVDEDRESLTTTDDDKDVSRRSGLGSLSTFDFQSDTLLQEKENHGKGLNGISLAQEDLRELFSFAAFLTLLPDEQTPQQMQELLRMSSTLKRLEYVIRNV